ncbi:MAG: hypothetical protein K2K26_11570 [Muribaculaceae bacterium]|nr:hypothetical protein [Muribaculaceae bacterium]
MKLKTLIPAAAIALIMTACGSESASDKSVMPANASTADSVMYYFGQMRAADYWRQTRNDTTLASEVSRQAYLRGLRAGIESIHANDEAYNQGLLMGMQMAMNMHEFGEMYNVKPNTTLLMQSLTTGLKNDSAVDMAATQREFTKLMNKLNSERETRLAVESAKILAKEGPALGMTKIDSTLYGKTLKPVQGENFKQGEKATVQINLTDLKGQPIKMRMPQEVTIGDRYVAVPISQAVSTMAPGEVKEFLTTAVVLMGQRSHQLNLEPTQPVRFTVTALPVAN